MTKNKKVLFHAPILEYPPRGGPEVSVINAIKALSEVSDLYITTTVSSKNHDSKETKKFLLKYCKNVVYLPSSILEISNSFLNKYMNRMKRLLAPILALVDLYVIISVAKRNKIKIFWIDRVLERAFYILYFLRKIKPSAFIVGDTEAVQSRFIIRELPMIENFLRKIYVLMRWRIAKYHETLLMNLASYVTAVSELDADYFRSLGNFNYKVKLFSNSVDLNDYDLPVIKTKKKATLNILLMGSFGSIYSPMDRAAKWLVYDIMPIVWGKIPNAHIYVVGKNSDVTQSDLNGPNVTVKGTVKSMLPYLHMADISVIPLRHESGTRFKIIQAGAAELPCVSTSLGAEGLKVKDGINIMIADSHDAFAHAIIDLLLRPQKAKSLGKALKKLINEEYGLDVQRKQAKEILNL